MFKTITKMAREWRSPAGAASLRVDPKTRCDTCTQCNRVGVTFNCHLLHMVTYAKSWCPRYTNE